VLFALGVAGTITFLFLLPTPWYTIGGEDRPDTPTMALKRLLTKSSSVYICPLKGLFVFSSLLK